MLGIDLDRADSGFDEDLRIVATPAARGLSQLVLRTDISGMPLEWIDYRESARLYHQEQVAYTCGSLLYKLYGGMNARTGRRTVLEVNSIVATVGHTGNPGNFAEDREKAANAGHICAERRPRSSTRRPASPNSTSETGASIPAATPEAHSSPIVPRSNTVTDNPCSRARQATARPTMPPPTTATSVVWSLPSMV